MLNENHFTKDAYEDNGRFQIHPLSQEGFEAYLSKDSYNYHYLKSKYDPALLKQIQDEINGEKLKKQEGNQNVIQNEQEKIEDIKEQKVQNIEKNKTGNKKPQLKKNNQIQKGNKGLVHSQIKKQNEKIKSSNPKSSITQKINNIGTSMNPVISNVTNDRGKLKDYQQPYHA